MDVSHIMVGGLTAATLVFLVWAELRSRRNTAVQESNPRPPLEELRPPAGKKERGR